MIKLKPIPAEIKEKFLQTYKAKYREIIQRLNRSHRQSRLIKYFVKNGAIDEQRIKDILIGEPNDLVGAIKSIGRIKGTSKSSIQIEFLRLYKYFTTTMGKSLCDELGIKVCPYCNRSYIHTLIDDGVRPQYDHFYSKIKFPYLAISIYNLIPSCSICNQSKGDFDTFKKNMLNPYTDEYGYKIFFEPKYTGDISYLLGGSTNFDLDINYDKATKESRKKARTSNSVLHTRDLYNQHKDYVLDIIRARQLYTDEYIQDLLIRFPNIFKSVEDIQRIAYMNYLNKDEWGERILAKLTYDIVNGIRS